MLIDIQALLQKQAKRETQAVVLPLHERRYDGYALAGPLSVALDVTPEMGAVRVIYTARPELAGVCARCAEPASQVLPLRGEYRVTAADLFDPEGELPFAPDGQLDLDELIYQDILLQAPMLLLCREDCPGLCTRCGQPKTSCTCTSEEDAALTTDPRWAALQNLTFDD